MKRYSLFLITALALHALIAIIILYRGESLTPTRGGGSGAAISITMSPAPPEDEGRRRVSVESRSQHSSGTDQSNATSIGSGLGFGKGPATGSESGLEGKNLILSEIRKRIESAKRYPFWARRQGLKGTAHVSFLIGKDGSISELSLVQSSGAGLLDREALETIHRAAPLPFYPDPIRIAIRFEISRQKD